MARANALRLAPILVVAAAVVLAGCSATDAAPEPTRTTPLLTDPTGTQAATASASAVPSASLAPNVPLYLVDINTTNELGRTLPTGILSGVKGTIPGGEVSQPFRDSLQQVDPTLTSDAYAAEAYDAVILAALGAATAQSDAGRDMAAQLVPLTNGETACTSYADCLALIGKGTAVSYEGRSGPLRLSAAGEPTQATVGVYTFGSDNQLLPNVAYSDVQVQPAKTQNAGTAAVQPGAGDGALTIGTLLPASGTLSFMRPAQLAGVRLAVQDIEAAGGVPGIDRIVLLDADSGDDSTTTAATGLTELLAKGVDVVVGTGATTTSGGVVPEATRAGVLFVAPVNSSLTPVTNRYDGLYWRMSPSSLAQGALLGTQIAADGHQRVAIVHSDDDYASSLAQAVAAAIPQSGGAVVANIGYDPTAVDFAAAVAKVKKAKPDAIALVGFDESAQVISELVQQGIGPNSAR